DQARGLHGGDKRGVVLRVDRVLDDVLRRIHRSPPDHDGLLLALLRERRRRGDGTERERGGGDGRQRDACICHCSSPVGSCLSRHRVTTRATGGGGRR